MFAPKASLRRVPQKHLFVSQPDPMWFGNPPNPASASSWTNKNWLKSRFHFSFAEYNADNNNDQFGVLRVLNDDVVQAQRGFGTHPHHNMEILTYVVNGHLTHKDSTGTDETLTRGAIQYMSAGSGVRHSEHNLHPTEPLRFIQTWILPRQNGTDPVYGSMRADQPSCFESRHNKWTHLCSDSQASSTNTPVKINQDCNLFVVEADPNVVVGGVTIAGNRQAYVVCMEGTATISTTNTANNNDDNTTTVEQHDGVELVACGDITVTAGDKGCFLMLYEMAFSPQYHGRTDL